MKTQHEGNFESCTYCQKYVRLGESNGNTIGYAIPTRRLHSASIRRQSRDDAMRSLGLIKVRGALGGAYWE